MKKRVGFLFLSFVLIFALSACNGGGKNVKSTTTASPGAAASASPKVTPMMEGTPDLSKTNIVITMDNGDKIKAELYPDITPVTVANFQNLIDQKFYDGLTFHRVINGFMIQGGDPKGNGTGGSETKIKGEFSKNGVENNLKHERGVLSMARSTDMNSASSQFFIVQKDANYLDGQYAAFGKVTEGMDIVDKIATDTPVTDQNGTVSKENQPKIKSIRFRK